MRLIKLAIISFVVFFGIALAMSLLIPSRIRISKATNIMAPKDSILALITNKQAWSRWHPAFKGQNVSEVLQRNHIDVTPLQFSDTLVIMKWQQDGKRPVVNGWQLHQFSATDSIALQWYMDFRLPWYPWQKFGSLFYEKTYGAMMEQGLADMKSILHE